jgi:hypothetical protein
MRDEYANIFAALADLPDWRPTHAMLPLSALAFLPSDAKTHSLRQA